MSYSVSLNDPATGEPHQMPEPFTDGGTYRVGGTNDCELNVTYNYGQVYGSLVSDLDGLVAHTTLPRLDAFLAQWLDAVPYKTDYWAPTPGNAIAAIERLASFARAHPSGIWNVQ